MNNMFIGDAFGYHIPRITALTASNFLDYALNYNEYGHITGKLTHLIYACFFNLANPIIEVYSNDDTYNVTLVVYIVNTVILVLVSLYLQKALKSEGVASHYIVYSIALILFSPFILAWSSFVVKETIHIALIIIVIVSIIKKSYFILFLAALFFFVDRMYMLYFIFLILLLSKGVSFNKKVIGGLIIFGIVFTLLPFEKYQSQFLYIINSYQDKGSSGDSLVSNNNILLDILRVLFGPFFLSAFKEKFMIFNIFFREHLMVTLLYTYFLFKLLLVKNNRFTQLLLLILLFNIILFPELARQKITILIPFLAIVYPLYLHSRKTNVKLDSYWRI